ncbi:MAG: hypothetical protein KGH75_00460 [Rhodospirillales bacterium]|nr:hypothetical protein [Rhodospirillales bacterium]
MTRLAFLDTETTGLDPDRHEVWEVGLILRDTDAVSRVGAVVVTDREYHWMLPVDLSTADPFALDIGRFHDRHPSGYRSNQDDHPERTVTDLATFARVFAELTDGAHLVGAVVSFDAERLAALVKRQGLLPAWHYHLVDVEALVAGRYGLEPPWDSGDLSDRAGVDVTAYDRHTALGDARWARDLYDQMMTDVGRRKVAAAEVDAAQGRVEARDLIERAGFTPSQRPTGAGW